MADDEDEDDDPADSASQSTSNQSEADDISRPSSAMSSISQRSKKCWCGNQLVSAPQLKGGNFWSMVEKWFSARMQPDQLGRSWSTPGWAKYVHFYFNILYSTSISNVTHMQIY